MAALVGGQLLGAIEDRHRGTGVGPLQGASRREADDAGPDDDDVYPPSSAQEGCPSPFASNRSNEARISSHADSRPSKSPVTENFSGSRSL